MFLFSFIKKLTRLYYVLLFFQKEKLSCALYGIIKFEVAFKTRH